MKKLIVLGSLLVLVVLSSCKKEYTCCPAYSNNHRQNTSVYPPCITEDMTKSEKEDKEAEGYECE